MPALGNQVFDNGLNHITNNTEKLYLLSAYAGLTWSNIASYAVGSKSAPAIASPSDRTAGGREVVVSAITDGLVTATGIATHYAMTDDSEAAILVSGELDAPLSVTSGGVFAVEEFAVGFPDPA
ncbi:hypothetical protein [uncultured Desulfobacter sp.]|uniref:hypothetical protein n=1 Tax=uncultured Desulfobacter sp. TaxID=240139 RepID=UPI0029C7E8C9|nr:hypothetical protein [uncultured Desulfobacter sp.]